MLGALAQRICGPHGGAEFGTLLAALGLTSSRRRPAGAQASARADGPLTALAEARARCLLRRVLDADQRRQYQAYGCFTVAVADRGPFGILPRRFFNVMELHTGLLYCCVTEETVPLADLMLAQKLLLECDPDLFFSTANATGNACSRDDRLRCLLTA